MTEVQMEGDTVTPAELRDEADRCHSLLSGEAYTYRKAADRIDELTRENESLSENLAASNAYAVELEAALRWYADEANWCDTFDSDDGVMHLLSSSPAEDDMGHRARVALGEEK